MLAKSKIVKGGKVSIPAVYRKSLKLKEGDEIIFNLNNNELTLIPIKTSLQKVHEMINLYHDPNISLVDKLIAERRAEAKMNKVILDSSALLALIKNEEGSSVVEELLGSIVMSSINVSEVASILLDSEMSAEQVSKAIEPFIDL